MRSIEKGDKAIILLPMDSNKWLMQWNDPFEVVKKVGINEYRAKIRDNRRLFHINIRSGEAGLTTEPTMCYLGYGSLDVVGHQIGQGESKIPGRYIESHKECSHS